jgi:hypothetical protein
MLVAWFASRCGQFFSFFYFVILILLTGFVPNASGIFKSRIIGFKIIARTLCCARSADHNQSMCLYRQTCV